MLGARFYHTATRLPGNRVLIAAGSDATFGNPAFSEIFGTNTPPVAYAGSDQTVNGAPGLLTPVTLTALSSHDDDGDALTYTWKKGSTILATTSDPTKTAVVAFP